MLVINKRETKYFVHSEDGSREGMSYKFGNLFWFTDDDKIEHRLFMKWQAIQFQAIQLDEMKKVKKARKK